MIMKAVWKFKFRTQSKGKGFKNLLSQDKCKLKWSVVKQLFLTNIQIFEKAGNERVKKEKRCKILYEMGSLEKKKISLATSSH